MHDSSSFTCSFPRNILVAVVRLAFSTDLVESSCATRMYVDCHFLKEVDTNPVWLRVGGVGLCPLCCVRKAVWHLGPAPYHSSLAFSFGFRDVWLFFSMATPDGASNPTTVQIQSAEDTLMKERIELKSKLVSMLDSCVSHTIRRQL